MRQSSTAPNLQPRRPYYLLASLLAATFPVAPFAMARSFIGGDNSSFGTASNWNPSGVPGSISGDVLTVGDSQISGLTGDLHVTLNGVFQNISSVTFDSVALPAALVINETGGTLSATTEILGNVAFGNTYNQSQGSANIATDLTIGSTAASYNDFYTLSDMGTALTVSDTFYLGLGGVGSFTQSDGTVTVHNASSDAFLILGSNSNSSGTYTLSGGNLDVDLLRVGESGAAVFNQNGGTVTVYDNATVSSPANSATATYNYSSGNATFPGGLSIGLAGFFNLQSGASLPFTVNVQSSGTFNTATAATTVGSAGVVNLSGGTFNLDGNLTLNGGSLIETSGTFSWTSTSTLTIQSGGAATITSAITTPTNAVINVSGTGSDLSFSGSTGSLTINSGAQLSVTSGGTASLHGLGIASSGNGTVLVDGLNSSLSALGVQPSLGLGGVGTLTFSNSASGSVLGLIIGEFGIANSGTLNVLSSATLTSSAPIDVGFFNGNASGAVNVTGGTLTLTGNTTLNVGSATNGHATVTVGTAGTLNTATGLTTVDATGEINLTGGVFNQNGALTVTGGSFTQTGGTFTVAPSQTMTVQSGGSVSLGGSQTLYTIPTLSLTGGTTTLTTGSAAKILVTSSLTISSPAELNLESNDMIVHNGTLGTVSTAGSITDEIAQARNTGAGGL